MKQIEQAIDRLENAVSDRDHPLHLESLRVRYRMINDFSATAETFLRGSIFYSGEANQLESNQHSHSRAYRVKEMG